MSFVKKNIEYKDRESSGVYKITNSINNKYYIGCTKNFINRFRSHLSSLKNNRSSCTILQLAVLKYGIENFEFSILEVCNNYKEREVELLNKLNPSYNVIKETYVGREISKKTREKMSKALIFRYKLNPPKKGYKRPNYKREKKYQISLSKGNTIEYTGNVQEISKLFNVTVQCIYGCIKKGRFREYNIKKI